MKIDIYIYGCLGFTGFFLELNSIQFGFVCFEKLRFMRIVAAIVFALFVFFIPGYAQNIDSLWILVHQSKSDSQKVRRYIDLAYAYRADSLKKSLEIARVAIQLASRTGFTTGYAMAYTTVGDINRLHGKYDTAIVAYQVGLEIYKNNLEKKPEDSVLLSKLANSYLQIGN